MGEKAKRATILDVAKRAGVGKVTVSYVLNGHSRSARISEETERRVLHAAKELGYRPNALARALVRQRTDTLAVAFQYAALFSSGSSFINELMRGVCAEAVELGVDLMLHTKALENPRLEADALSDGRVDGVLILRDRDDPTVVELLDRGFPTVLFFTRSDHPNAAWVDADNFAGGRLAARHLLGLGHRRIAMIMGPHASTAANDRFQGYRDALEEAGLAAEPELLVRAGSRAEALDVLPHLFGRSNRPTAVFAWSDEVAIAALDYLRAQGIGVPAEVSVVGFDSLSECERSNPPLTSIAQPVSAMAAAATRMLVDLAANRPTPRTHLSSCALEERGSTCLMA